MIFHSNGAKLGPFTLCTYTEINHEADRFTSKELRNKDAKGNKKRNKSIKLVIGAEQQVFGKLPCRL